MKTNFRKGSSSRHVLTLMTGTALAQAIPIAISPILTRLYTPSDFGLLALFMALAAVPSAIASGRYELAIQLASDDDEAVNVAALSLAIAAVVVIFLIVLVLLADNHIARLTGNDGIRLWLYLIPVSVLLSAVFTVLSYLNSRAKQFQDIAQANVFRSIILSVLQLCGGAIKAGAAGLIVGQVASLFAANGRLYRNAIQGRNVRKIVSRERIREVAGMHSDLPKFTLWSGLANSIALNGAGILISAFYSISTLGFYALVQRVLGAPISLIGSAAGQVFFQRASATRNSHGSAYPVFKSASRSLMLLSVLIFVPLYFTAEPLIAFIFGEEWRVAGQYARVLTPLFAVRFVVSPLSLMNQVNKKNKAGMLVNILLLAVVVGAIVVSAIARKPALEMFTILAIAQTVVYVGFFFYIEYTSRRFFESPGGT